MTAPASDPGDVLTLQFTKGDLTVGGASDPSVRLGGKWTFDPRIGLWTCDAQDYHLLKLGGVVDKARAWSTLPLPEESALHPLRKAQKDAMSGWLAKKRGIVIKPTGAGKTQVAMHLIRKLKCTTLVVVPTLVILHQWKAEILKCLGYDCGIIGDGEKNPRPITLTTYASACIYMEEIGNRFQLIIWDEVHHLHGEYRGEAVRMSAAPYRLGLTATPPKGEDRDLLIEMVGEVCYEQRIEDAVEDGTLAEYDVISYNVHIPPEISRDFKRLGAPLARFYQKKKRERRGRGYVFRNLTADAGRGDPEAKKMLRAYYRREEMIDTASSKLDMVETLFLRHAGVPTLIWAGSNAMARKIALRFLIPVLSGETTKEERAAVLAKFRKGECRALVTCEVLNEGVDLPTAKLGIILGGTSSTTEAIQRLGRLLRRDGDKKAILYDVYCVDSQDEKRAWARNNNSTYQWRPGMERRTE